MDNISPTVAAKVAETMHHLQVSKNKLSEESGLAYTTLNRKLKGNGSFTIVELGSIAKALNLTLADLIPSEVLDAA